MEFKRLGDLATYINGYAFKPEQWGKNGLPIIRIQNLNNVDAELNYFDGEIDQKYVINHGDVLIAWSASLGVYEWQREKALLNQHIFKVVFNKLTVDKTYFKFMVSYALNLATKYLHGSTMKHITKKYFDEIKIPYPDISIQERLGKALEQVMNLQKKRQSQITALDELTQSLFLEMFGDPIQNNKKFKQMPLKQVLSDIKTGWSPVASKEPAINNEPGVLKLSAVTGGRYNFVENKKLLDGTPFKSEYEVKIGDILLTRKNTKELVGACSYVFDTPTQLMFSDLIFKLNIKDTSLIQPIYLWRLLNNSMMKKEISSLASGSSGSMPNISKKNLNDLLITIPPIDLQKVFVNKIIMFEKLRNNFIDSLNSYEKLYKSTLQKAFKGELFQEQ